MAVEMKVKGLMWDPVSRMPIVILRTHEGESLLPIFVEVLEFKSATRHRFGRPSAIRTYPSFSPTGPLDKIYFRGGLRLLGARSCRLGVSRVASDHLPIVAEFELT